ncbi:YpoC family protein [Alkalicoccobacillus murimartini]|uniref:YpoC-like domain-containing protein n=1 Tax=Alkalicoccobacillus murimartini TaxID=171685 RepID=A0ABT9YFH1_9BACI|nr:hypothetical protein [Alkalicoccobacillus murimartini]MDQ0205962.1 hypothetical protein [Alkalicoccobacillus murimartini]
MTLIIPESFVRDPFYEKGSFIQEPNADASLSNGDLPLFWFDLLTDEGQSNEGWDRDRLLPALFKRWHTLNEQLADYHEQENKEVVARLTPEFTALVIEAIFWINHKKVPCLIAVENELDHLPHLPPNSKDRLHFVLIAPWRYRSFIQMRSLMEELEKLYARLRILESKGRK